MARRYDSSTTTFSPEGRLHQVEYAMEAINNAGTCVGIKCKNGIVLANERKILSKLLSQSSKLESDKIATLSSNIVASIAGLASDANILVKDARLNCGRYMYRYDVPMPTKICVKDICDAKQSYTQFGGLRPYGVSLIVAGVEEDGQVSLFQTDPSGNFTAWEATVIGANNGNGKTFLKNEYDKDSTGPPSIHEGTLLAIKTLNKTMDITTPSATGQVKYDLFTIEMVDGEVVQKRLSEDKVKDLVQEVENEDADMAEM